MPKNTPSMARKMASIFYEMILLATLTISLTGLATLLNAQSHLISIILSFTISCYFLYQWQKGGQTLAMKAWKLKIYGNKRTYILRLVYAWVFFMVIPLAQYHILKHHQSELSLGYKLAISSIWAFWPIIYSYFDSEGQFLHDRLAGTYIYAL